MSRRKVVVLVGFGTSSEEARKVYGAIERRVREFVPEYAVRWAFTSGRIVAKLRGQGVVIPTLAEAVEELRRERVETAVFQPLLTVPGQEYTKLREMAEAGGWRVGGPLLDSSASVEEVMAAMAPSLRQGCVNVVVCHGNGQHPEYNTLLVELAAALEARYRNVVVASVEGSPGTAPLERVRGTEEVHFVPFMVVAGEHVQRDVMGDHAESWKNVTGAARVTCGAPLGATEAMVELYLRRLGSALEAGR